MLNLYDFLQSSLWEKSISLCGVCGSPYTTCGPPSLALWCGRQFFCLIFRWVLSVTFFGGLFLFLLTFCDCWESSDARKATRSEWEARRREGPQRTQRRREKRDRDSTNYRCLWLLQCFQDFIPCLYWSSLSLTTHNVAWLVERRGPAWMIHKLSYVISWVRKIPHYIEYSE